jgi:Protein of unknown function (DUF3306)
MPKAPDDPAIDEASSFLKRWSERKARSAEQAAFEPVPETVPTEPAPASERAAPDGDPENAAGNEPATDAPPPVTEADLENLTYESDYTKFMGENVPEALRRRALRQLWRSDPILANVDGLCDYDDDYTDAALAVKVLKTAHKVGQGYLTDEEVEANRARGRPPEQADEKADRPTNETAGDDVDDLEDIDEELVAGTESGTADTALDDPDESDAANETTVNLKPDTSSPEQTGSS